LFVSHLSIAYNTSMKLESEIAAILKKKKKTIALAESCTGGLISHRITNIPGSSKYFKGEIVAYSNEIKRSILDVPSDIIKKNGAVSRAAVRAMAKGARSVFGTDIAAAVTGIAGPGGGSRAKPVGLAYIAVCSKKSCKTRKILVKGSREEIKSAFAEAVLREIREFLN